MSLLNPLRRSRGPVHSPLCSMHVIGGLRAYFSQVLIGGLLRGFVVFALHPSALADSLVHVTRPEVPKTDLSIMFLWKRYSRRIMHIFLQLLRSSDGQYLEYAGFKRYKIRNTIIIFYPKYLIDASQQSIRLCQTDIIKNHSNRQQSLASFVRYSSFQ